FTVTLSVESQQTVTVAYSTSAFSAAAVDFQSAVGTLTFAPGQTSKTVEVAVLGDRIPEANETFFLNLSSPSNAYIVDRQGAGTITDDDPRVNVGDVTKAEGKQKQTTLFTFTVTLSIAYDLPVTVSYSTVNGFARSGEDFTARSGTLTFSPG